MKKIAKFFNRHPLAYFIRYILMSENVKKNDLGDLGCFNNCNSLASIPTLYFEINTKIGIDSSSDEYDKALQIGKYLRSTMKGGPGIGLSSQETLEKMLANKGGVCSDFSQIFNIFCFINNIKVKEWGCIDRFYKTQFGHSFNEIYSSDKQKWVAIDIHKGIVFTDNTGSPLSVVELFLTLRSGNHVNFTHYSDYVSPDHDRTPRVYAPYTIPFIISNNKNDVTDFYFEKYQNILSPILINSLILLRRKNHKFLFVMDDYKAKLRSK
ncbi:MAG: hypothetical protein IPP30_03035 [Flavobacterium sp.]|nr:hypothetical protein [Flavobacterium sp.]